MEAEGQPTPPSRLIIKEMVLENFKSYAGAQSVGPFHKVGFHHIVWKVLPSIPHSH